MPIKVISKNRKAKYEYFIFEQYEAGIVLQGSEIKSVRAGQVSIAEAYVRIDSGEAWIIDLHIAHYEQAGIFNHEPKRPRKLLLHRREIRHLWDQVRKKGVTIIPLKMYLKDGLAKVEIAIVKGKKLFDKRQVIASRDAQREIERQYHGKYK